MPRPATTASAAIESVDQLLPSETARFEEVCRFGQDKREAIASTVTRAFADDPIWMWIYDTSETLEFETGIVLGRLLVAESSAVDQIHGFRDFGAVALWSAPEDAATEEMKAQTAKRMAPLYEPFAAQIGDRVALTGQLTAGMREHHPSEPHWYLGILGTDPDRQNQGLGGKVLAAMHERCDRTGVGSFLFSSNPRNYGFYQRHGYTETESFTVAGSPSLLGFWRSPATAG